MPRQVAPPPSGEFQVKLSKPFSGPPSHEIEVIGEPNRSATIRLTNYTSGAKSNEKTGEIPSSDVQELLSLIRALRGFPSHAEKDVYAKDTKLDFNTFEIQWSNGDDDSAADVVNEIAAEQKDEFGRVVESVEALARSFAKRDAAV